MESVTHFTRGVERRLTRGTFRHLLAFAAAVTLSAQPASMSTVKSAVIGPGVFDSSGNLYIYQRGPVTAGAAQTQPGGGTCLASNGFFSFPGPCPDAYLGKVDPSGKLIFGTYLGGSTADQSTAIAVDRAGNVFVTGTTGGAFPTTANAAIASSTAPSGFAAKVSADGSRVLYATYLPDGDAAPAAIAVDSQGNAYIGGKSSTGHAFLVKLSADGTAFAYKASLAGAKQEAITAIVADSAGNLVAAGQTSSPDFPVSAKVFQSRLKGAQNAFVARLDASGAVTFATYLGGSGVDIPYAVQTDSAGNVYVAGQTSSLDFPTTPGTLQPAPNIPMWNNTSPAGFAARLTADGASLAWSTYVMSVDHPVYRDVAQPVQGVDHLAVTPAGDVYVAGLTGPGFPVTPSAPQVCFDGSGGPESYSGRGDLNAFVAHLDARGALLDATYAGQGVAFTHALGLAADGSILLALTTSDAIVRAQLRFGGPGSSAPACLSPAVLNAATLTTIPYSTGGASVVPGQFITLTGFGIGPESGVVPPVSNVQVFFDGQAAPVLYAQARQINVMAPVELSGKSQTNIRVVFNQATIGAFTATVVSAGFPGIFRLHPGVSTDAAALNQDGAINTPATPAARGSVVSVWGTGFGMIDPPCATGGLNPPGPANLAAGLGVDIANGSPPGVPVVYNPALYAGGAPTLPCGVVQINLQVPRDIAPGLYQFFPWSMIALGNGAESAAASDVGVTIWVR